MKNKQLQGGFTLIELMIVVGIIALLAAGAFPIFSKVMFDSQVKSKVRDAYSIHVGLINYATSHDGDFPDGLDGQQAQDANTAYRHLFISGATDSEDNFYVKNCKWCSKKPDGNIGKPEDNYAQALEPGENHWGYTRGLNNTSSDSRAPIIWDGSTESSPGKWARDPNVRGGVWKGKYAIVVRVAGNAKAIELDQATLTVKEPKEGQNIDIFSQDFANVPTENNLNPASGG